MSIKKIGFTTLDVINAQNGSQSFKSIPNDKIFTLSGIAVDDTAVDKKTGNPITITYLKDGDSGEIYGGNSENVRMTANALLEAADAGEITLPLSARFSTRTSKNDKEFISLIVTDMWQRTED